MGTTVSAMLLVGDRVVIAHIGDSRIYLLRDGRAQPDHHRPHLRAAPRRRRAHHRRGGDGAPAPLGAHARARRRRRAPPRSTPMVLDTRAGDRWLLCSDGLSGVVSFDEMHELIVGRRRRQAGRRPAREGVARRRRARQRHGRRSSTSAIRPRRPRRPLVVGSAAAPARVRARRREPARARGIRLPHRSGRTPCRRRTSSPTRGLLRRAHRGGRPPSPTASLDVELLDRAARRRDRRRVPARLPVDADALLRRRVQRHASPSSRASSRTSGRSRCTSCTPRPTIDVADLRTYDQQRVEQTISAGSFSEAFRIVQRLEDSVE